MKIYYCHSVLRNKNLHTRLYVNVEKRVYTYKRVCMQAFFCDKVLKIVEGAGEPLPFADWQRYR